MMLVAQPSISSDKHKFYQTFIDNINFCAHMHIYSRPDTTLDPPPSSPSPLSWASYHQSLGVLCAQPEWLGWALPFIAVLGAAACILLQHHRQILFLTPLSPPALFFHPNLPPKMFFCPPTIIFQV